MLFLACVAVLAAIVGYCVAPKAVAPQKCPISVATKTREFDVDGRDRRVLSDALYPSLSRADRPAFDMVVEKTRDREINVPTRGGMDTYRLVGYLTNEDDERGPWKLFGRNHDRNIADFYVSPADRNIDMKIQLTQNMINGPRLSDVDLLPDSITFKTPLLKSTPYAVTELPKTDFRSQYV
jgi:hypothetical protein